MAVIKWFVDTALKTCLNTATEGTALASLADAGYAISNSTGDIDNRTNLDLFGDFEMSFIAAASLSAGARAVDLYLLPSVDNTNFPDGATVDPQLSLYLGVFTVAVTGTTHRLVIPGIPLPPQKCRMLIKNISGQAFTAATTHTLKCRAYQYQAV